MHFRVALTEVVIERVLKRFEDLQSSSCVYGEDDVENDNTSGSEK